MSAEAAGRQPKVTALLPCYNAERFLSETLGALERQTCGDLEILIGDDGSTDRTPEIVRAFAEGRPHVRTLFHPENLGWVGNSNALIAEARGEYLFFAFHDDVVAPDYVARLSAALDADPRAAVAYADMETIETDGTRRVERWGDPRLMRTRFLGTLRLGLKIGAWYAPMRGLFRASAVGEGGGLRRHAGGEFEADWPWLVHLATRGRFVRVPAVLSTKRYKETSLSRSWAISAERNRMVADQMLRELAESPLPPLERRLLLGLLRLRHASTHLSWLVPTPLRHALRRALS